MPENVLIVPTVSTIIREFWGRIFTQLSIWSFVKNTSPFLKGVVSIYVYMGFSSWDCDGPNH